MSERIALIGAGGVAQRHARVLSDLPGVEIASVTDLDPAAAAALSRTVGARAFTDPAEALDDETLAAAYVCVPPFAHGAAERAVLARGLPLFVEKPIGLALEETEALAAAVREAGVATATGYHWRCLSTVDTLREELAARPALLASGYWWDKRPPVGWWQRMDRSGGQVIEQLTHVTDLARHLLGEAVSVSAHAGRVDPVDPSTDVDDATAALIRFASGAIATLTATCALTAKHGAGLTVTAPGLVAEIGEEELEIHRDGTSTRHAPSEDPRIAVDREFIDVVRGERESARVPFEEALATHRLGLAVVESARTGRTVQL